MWAAMDRLQRELVERRGLISVEDQRSLMLAVAIIPAPKFLAFAAMVGYRIGGIVGAISSLNRYPSSWYDPGLGRLCLDRCRVREPGALDDPALRRARCRRTTRWKRCPAVRRRRIRQAVGLVLFVNQCGNTALRDCVQEPTNRCGLCWASGWLNFFRGDDKRGAIDVE